MLNRLNSATLIAHKATLFSKKNAAKLLKNFELNQKESIAHLDDTESELSTKVSAILAKIHQQQVDGALLLEDETSARDLVSNWNECFHEKMMEASNSLTTWQHDIQLQSAEWMTLNSDSRK